MGVALLLLFLQVLPGLGLGTTAQAIGQVTFTLSYVVVIVRGRLVSIGPDYEEAAADLGAPPHDQLLRVLLPLLAPAIVASAAVVFALSIDDFVVTQYLSSDAGTTTVPMLLYSSARGAPTPALNALATITLADHARNAGAGLRRVPEVRGRRRCRVGGNPGGLTSMPGEIRLDELTKSFERRRGRGRRHRPAHAGGRVLHDGRPVRLREDDHAAHDRGLRAADERPDPPRRRRHGAGAAAQAERQHGVPELRAVPASRRRRQRRVRPQVPALHEGGAAATGGGGARGRAAHRVRATQARSAVRGPAAADRSGAGARSESRACSSSTSRSAPSTPACGRASRWSSRRCRPTSGSPSCSSRTTRRRR